jgi:hypothetical protein
VTTVTREVRGNNGCLGKSAPVIRVFYKAGAAGQDNFDFYLQAVDGTYHYEVSMDVR